MVFISTQKRQRQFLITCHPHYKSLGRKAVSDEAATLCLETAWDPIITSSHARRNGIQQASEILSPGVNIFFPFKIVLWALAIWFSG